MRTGRRRCWGWSWVALCGAVLGWGWAVAGEKEGGEGMPEPLRLVVMDPLALPLSCACVPGLGQRRYEVLAEELEARLGVRVEVVFEEGLALGMRRLSGPVHGVIGKRSVVEHDAGVLGMKVRALAELTGADGARTVEGVFVVREDAAARELADLAGQIVALGPVEDAEAHEAGREALRAAGLLERVSLMVAGSMDGAALAVADGEAGAAVVAAHVPALMAGCGKIGEGELRVVGRTAPVPFVTVFGTGELGKAAGERLARALPGEEAGEELLEALESQRGFVRVAADGDESESQEDGVVGWTDWRGKGRAGLSAHVPEALPEELEVLWTAPLTGPAMAGITATERFVLVPDKSEDLVDDVLRCLDAATGRELWVFEEEAPGAMDYSNAPRASAVIAGELVYFQGAFGPLLCFRLETGEVVWRRHLYEDFGAELLTWGASSPPLVDGDRLILNPGGAEASVVSVDRHDGRELWRALGPPAAYSAFIVGELGGVRQIVGYDSVSLGGWDPETGRRLWSHVPRGGSDFNVTTPVALAGGRLLLATENNGTRLHGFRDGGELGEEAVAVNEGLAPDTCTPVVVDGRVFAAGYGALHCLDLAEGLRTVWTVEDDLFYDHVSLIGGNGRVLVWTMDGTLILLRADAEAYEELARLRPFGEEKFDSMALPAVMPGRLYVRSGGAVKALRMP